MSKKIRIAKRDKLYSFKKTLRKNNEVGALGSIICCIEGDFHESNLFLVIKERSEREEIGLADLITSHKKPVTMSYSKNLLFYPKLQLEKNFTPAIYEDFKTIDWTKYRKNKIISCQDLKDLLADPIYKYLQKEGYIVQED